MSTPHVAPLPRNPASPPQETRPGDGAAALSLLRAWDDEDKTRDPAELEARRAEWDAMKAALNEAHGSDRKLFP